MTGRGDGRKNKHAPRETWMWGWPEYVKNRKQKSPGEPDSS